MADSPAPVLRYRDEMTTTPIHHDDNPPAVAIAGEGTERGVVNATTIMHSHELALASFKIANGLGDLSADPRAQALQDAVKQLSDAVLALSGEVSQIARGARHGLISVHD